MKWSGKQKETKQKRKLHGEKIRFRCLKVLSPSARVDAFLFRQDVARAQKSGTEGHLANLICAFNFCFHGIEETSAELGLF